MQRLLHSRTPLSVDRRHGQVLELFVDEVESTPKCDPILPRRQGHVLGMSHSALHAPVRDKGPDAGTASRTLEQAAEAVALRDCQTKGPAKNTAPTSTRLKFWLDSNRESTRSRSLPTSVSCPLRRLRPCARHQFRNASADQPSRGGQSSMNVAIGTRPRSSKRELPLSVMSDAYGGGSGANRGVRWNIEEYGELSVVAHRICGTNHLYLSCLRPMDALQLA